MRMERRVSGGFLRRRRRLSPALTGAPDAGKKTLLPPSAYDRGRGVEEARVFSSSWPLIYVSEITGVTEIRRSVDQRLWLAGGNLGQMWSTRVAALG
jgi:hypothetical protein